MVEAHILQNREYEEWHNEISKYAYVTSMWVQLQGQVLIRVLTHTHTATHNTGKGVYDEAGEKNVNFLFCWRMLIRNKHASHE